MSARSRVWVVLLLTTVLCPLTVHAIAGSFYGDSYIRLPLEDASATTDLQLHFRSHAAEGLLLLAAGSPDYCVLELWRGMLRVRIDLGSGEATLTSSPGIRFDDWRWHHVRLVRTQADVTLTIDGLYTTRTTTPGRFFELNINHGVFLGGLGAFTDLFFGNLQSYRGCVRQVSFNTIDVFHITRARGDPMNVYGVTWDCSGEFGATSQQAISFLQNTSFMALPPLSSRQEARCSFDLRTRTPTALLFYNAGQLQSPDFFAVELVDGYPKITVNKGSGVAHLMSDRAVNDATWHQMEVLIDLTTVRITIDGYKQELRTNFGDNRFLDLHGHLFMGGVSLQARGQAITKGLASLMGMYAPAGSLVGCIQNVQINGMLLGFREAEITRGVQAECVWLYPCLSSPCIDGAECVEQGYHTYSCICEQAQCERVPGSDNNEPPASVNAVLAMQDVVVREAGRAYITTNHINIIADYTSVGLRTSDIIFRVVSPPQHGEIQLNNGSPRGEPVFSLQDMQASRVSYVHDGSEGATDSVGLELEFTSLPDHAPSTLTVRYGFVLIVKVAAWNDRPVIILPEEDMLILVQNTQVKITPKILNVLDKDDGEQSLEYNIEYPADFDTGYFEISDHLGVRARITKFTQEDINEGRVQYIHRGSLQAQIGLQVSDGKDSSDSVTLMVHAVPLELRIVRNTGIRVPPGGGELIFKDNLTFATNAPNQDIDIRYEIIEPPYNGEVQRQQYADNRWTTVTTFNQRHIDKSRLRYIHSYPSHHKEDSFRFNVVALGEETQEYSFRIHITDSDASLLINSPLLLRGIKNDRITPTNLRAVSSVDTHKPVDIHYVVVSPPTHGSLFLMASQAPTPNKQVLLEGSNFTQADINMNRIHYVLSKVLFTPIEDSLQFRLSIPGSTTDLHSFAIHYEPMEAEMQVINNGLVDVYEGKSKVITREELYIETDQIHNWRYTIISGPQHGWLEIIDPVTGDTLETNITSFTTDDIQRGRIMYQHDNTETVEDHFNFMCTPLIDSPEMAVEEINEITGTFNVQILLQNDNAPVRVIQKVINVVTNQGRILTPLDLLYADPDTDFDSSQLQYKWNGVANGMLMEAHNHSAPMRNFTQRDLVDGNVYFQHRGVNMAQGAITVSDGLYFSTGMIQVRASDPYIKFANNTGVSVLRGDAVAILPSNLSIETNIDIQDRDIKFIVVEAPQHGQLLKNEQPKNRFHMGDLRGGNILYHHDNTMNLHDSFTFVVRVQNVRIEGQMRIRILRQSHPDPPRIISSHVIEVDEGRNVYITSDALRVGHPDTQDDNILYTITTQPQHGTLSLQGVATGADLHTFTQSDVNVGHLQYIHNKRGAKTDTFRFDVTNGIQSLRGLEVVFEIVPRVIPLEVSSLTLQEGESIPLSTDLIRVDHRHFLSVMFVVIKAPMHGSLESESQAGMPLLWFRQQQLEQGLVYYVHDGSDTTEDTFTIMAREEEGEKKSHPHTIDVHIQPVNDQSPMVIINQGLQVWSGSTRPITAEELLTKDDDIPAEQLMYMVGPPTNGELSLQGSGDRNLVNFTQALLTAGLVLFTHSGVERGEFGFHVSDGVHSTEQQWFRIQAQPLHVLPQHNTPIKVFPSTSHPITAQHLAYITNDINQTHTLTYTVTQPPTLGEIVLMSEESSAHVRTFTQADINDGRLYFEQLGGLDTWYEMDSFIYDVSTTNARGLSEERFALEVGWESVNAENHESLVIISAMEVEEGSRATMTKQNLDSSLLREALMEAGLQDLQLSFRVTSPPMHGILNVNGENATVNTRFAQKDINKGRMHYMHDHSDSLWDVFEFVVDVGATGGVEGEKSAPQMDGGMVFNITVLPLNDQPFVQRVESPELEMVQGFIANITQRQLYTEDPDTPAREITYQVQSGPENGHIVLADNADQPISTFTQQDINDGIVQFIQDGSMESSAFYFSVSDGQFPAKYKVFKLTVYPLTLELRNTSTLEVIQGHSSAVLTPEHFNIITNGDPSKLLFNVTRAPLHGGLFLTDQPVQQFSQRQLVAGQVSYIQMDMTHHHDHFEYMLYDTQNQVRGQQFNISVRPLVQQQPAASGESGELVLSTASLDASQLAAATGSNPVFTVTVPPMYGSLYKSYPLRYRRAALRPEEAYVDDEDYYDYDMDMEEVSNFTHQDVLDEVVVYRVHPDAIQSPDTDDFEYLLTAPRVQPAPGIFSIDVVPPILTMSSTQSSVSPDYPTPGFQRPTRRPVDEGPIDTPPPIDEKQERDDGSRNISEDHKVIIILVCVITFLTIVVLIITRCLKHRRHKLYKKSLKEDSQSPLAQPNVQVEPPKGEEGEGGPEGGPPLSGSMDKLSRVPSHSDSMTPPPSLPQSWTSQPAHGHPRSRSVSPSPYGQLSRSHSPEDFPPPPPPLYPAVTIPRNYHSSRPHPSQHYSLPRSKSQDALKSEVSRTVPTCKVTPLFDSESRESMDGLRTPGGTLQPYDGTLKCDKVSLDWENMDPELLQHCRTTNPVLHDNKYWV